MTLHPLPSLPAFVPPSGAGGSATAPSFQLPPAPAALAARSTVAQASDLQSAPFAASPQGATTTDKATTDKAVEAAVKFESFFIAQMMRNMRKTVREVAAEDSSYKSSVNDEMLDLADMQVADSMAKLRSFGIANTILKQILPQLVAEAKKLS